jgi:hypothetical protein
VGFWGRWGGGGVKVSPLLTPLLIGAAKFKKCDKSKKLHINISRCVVLMMSFFKYSTFSIFFEH